MFTFLDSWIFLTPKSDVQSKATPLSALDNYISPNIMTIDPDVYTPTKGSFTRREHTRGDICWLNESLAWVLDDGPIITTSYERT